MHDEFSGEQEKFWAGAFGDDYSRRNVSDELVASNCALFAKVLSRARGIRSIVEFGPNIGLNLRALSLLLPGSELAGIEINQVAIEQLRNWGGCEVFQASVVDFEPPRQYDLSLVKGVLIHIHPESLRAVYERLFRASRRYVCVVEYYSPTPVSVPYRGHTDRLFKRDFAGELLDQFTNLRLVDYGFCWRRDPVFPQDDVTWFLLEKL